MSTDANLPDDPPAKSGIYQIEPEAQPPELPGQVILKRDDEELHHALGSDLMLHALNCVRTFGSFHLALSGGSTPIPFYCRLMVDPLFRPFPWTKTHLWLVDERRVPFDDELSNYKHIHECLVEHSGIPQAQVHPIPVMDVQPDVTYEDELEQTLGWRERGHDRLDFVLLGMGGDGHTASLFPHSPALDEQKKLIALNSGPTVTPPERVTMTYRLINAARFVAVLVTGEGKRKTIARIEKASEPTTDLPILGVKPSQGSLHWYLDHAACPNQPA